MTRRAKGTGRSRTTAPGMVNDAGGSALVPSRHGALGSGELDGLGVATVVQQLLTLAAGA